MIGQIAIPKALIGFNDLGRSVASTFVFRNRCYLQLSARCPKINKKSMWEVKKKFKISVHATGHGQIAIPKALIGINDLGRTVASTFVFRSKFYLQLPPRCPKMNKKSMWEVKKKSRFLSTGHGILPSCGCKASETMVAKCELVR